MHCLFIVNLSLYWVLPVADLDPELRGEVVVLLALLAFLPLVVSLLTQNKRRGAELPGPLP